MRWIELALVTEAAGSLVLSFLNCLYFLRLALSTRQAARRIGSLGIALVSLGFAAEATAYLALAAMQSGIELLAVLALRTLLLSAVGFLSLLVWRRGWRRP